MNVEKDNEKIHFASFSDAKEAFEPVMASVNKLCAKLGYAVKYDDSAMPAWVRGYGPPGEVASDDTASARAAAAGILSSLEYQDDLDANEITRLPGVIAASRDTVAFIVEVNMAKAKAKIVLDKMLLPLPDGESFFKRVKTEMHWRRLHYRMVIRKIRYLENLPYRVGFTESRSKSIIKPTAGDCIAMLNGKKTGANDFALDRDIAILEMLDPKEILAKMYLTPDQIRMNVAWRNQSNADVEYTRKMIKCSLPLFVLMRPGQDFPLITDLTGDAKPPARQRMDVKIEKTPLLKTMSIYRYLPAFRKHRKN